MMFSRIRKIAILNAYDHRNLGDHAIILSQIAWCKRYFPEARVEIASHSFLENRQAFGDASVEPLFYSPPAGNPVWRVFRPILDIASWMLGSTPKACAFDEYDMFLLCGGGYLYSSRAPFVSRNMILACLHGIAATLTGRPVVPFPQSFGPFSKEMDGHAATFMSRFLRVVTPRDASSHEWLSQQGLEAKSVLVPDVVLAMRSLCPELYGESTAVRRGMGIAPVDFRFARAASEQEMFGFVLKLADVAAYFHQKTGEEVVLFIQVTLPQKDDDGPIVRLLERELRGRGIPVRVVDGGNGLQPYIDAIQRVRLFLGCRMHACIFSLTTGTPTIGLAYQPKFKGMFERMELSEWLGSVFTLEADAICRKVDAALERAPQLGIHIRDRIGSSSMEILHGMAMAARRAGVSLPEFSLSPAESAQARQSEKHRAVVSEADVSKSDMDRPDITVVTPSYRQLPWLRLCAASVQDQMGVRVEHIIQDADSGPELAEWVRTHTRARLHVESDFGMYDAINRGFRRARGGIIAWLNSDEQYLEGALRKVVDFFRENPDVDVLFGDALLINNLGQPISYRRAILPTLKHVRFSHLNTLSCSAFVRKSVVDRGLLLDIRWKAIADAVWVAAMLEAGVRMATLSEPLAAFTITDKNLGQSSLAFTETERWQSQTGSNSPFKRSFYVAGHRFRKFRHGAYLPRHVVTKLYQLGDVEKRRLVEAKGLGFFWPGSE